MSYLSVAQYMAAAAFFTVAAIHWFVWTRVRREFKHFLFAVTALLAGVNALSEEFMYRADSLDVMCTALRWYVATSGLWAIATVLFIAAYARVGHCGRYLAIAIIAVCCLALIVNSFSPASFLYTELTDLREIELPWGERFWLASGINSPLRLLSEIALVAILGVVADGCYRMWRLQQKTRALLFGAAVLAFMLCFGTHALLVDTGILDSPYLSTFGFLAVVAWTSYDLAGEVMRTSELSTQLERKEVELQTAVAAERSRIANDLHDSVTQTLFSTAAIAEALPEVWQRQPEEALRGLQDLRQLTTGALAEMRTLLWELRPRVLVETPLIELLRQLASATAGRTRMPVEVENDGERRLPQDVKVVFYRAAQEALHNIVKHAEATQAEVRLRCHGEEVLLTIRDNGCGFDAQTHSPTGMGLAILRERVRGIGGQVEIDSNPGVGTTVTVKWTDQAGRGDEQ